MLWWFPCKQYNDSSSTCSQGRGDTRSSSPYIFRRGTVGPIYFLPLSCISSFFLNCFLLFLYMRQHLTIMVGCPAWPWTYSKAKEVLNFQASYFNIWNNWVHKPESPGLSSSIFIFLRNRLTLLHKGGMNFHSYQQCTRGLFLQGGPQHHTVNLNNTQYGFQLSTVPQLSWKKRKRKHPRQAKQLGGLKVLQRPLWAGPLCYLIMVVFIKNRVRWILTLGLSLCVLSA